MKKSFKVVIDFCVALILFLVLAEIVVRIFISQNIDYDIEMWKYAKKLKRVSANPLLLHEHKPSSKAHLMNVDVQINQDGLRDQDYPAQKEEGHKRVLLVGDSITMGWGVDQSKTLDALLEEEWDKQGPVEVINLGIGNYNAVQQVERFRELGLKYHPDQVVWLYYINNAEKAQHFGGNPLVRYSALAALLKMRLDIVWRKLSVRQDYKAYYQNIYQQDYPGWIQCQQAMRQMVDLCQKEQIKLLFVIIPELHFIGQDYPFLNIHKQLIGEMEQQNIPVLDLYDTLRNQADIHVASDDVHPNSKGHALMAKAILDKLHEI